LRRQGKDEEALRALEGAVALDPQNVETLVQMSVSYQTVRQYGRQAAVLERALEIAPDDLAVAAARAGVDLAWKASTDSLHRLVEQVRAERPASLNDIAPDWFLCALAEHDWQGAEQALAVVMDGVVWADGLVHLRRSFGEGLLARAMHDEERAHRAFTAARREQDEMVQKQKDYAPALCVLGLVDAALGNKEQALQEGRRAMELLPVEQDRGAGQALIAYFAIIAAWAGEKDLALQQLAFAAPTPGARAIACYGVLKLTPFWDPLRGDPRFEKIVASLAPADGQ
jgi:serine/threonine-protein kinase